MIKVKCIRIDNKLRVRPLPGQGFYTSYNVQFPKEVRKAGKVFEVNGLVDAGGFYRMLDDYYFPVKRERNMKNKTPKFKMRQPPTKLTKDTIVVRVEVGKEYTMGGVAQMVASEIATRFPGKEYSKYNFDYIVKHLDQIVVTEKKGKYYYSPSKTCASFAFTESEADFEARLERFATPLAEYNSWRKANAQQIKEHEARIAAKAQEKALKRKAALDKKMLALQSKLNKLQAAA